MPKFCIVIPSFNSEETIYDCISSALNQDFSDYSIVFSDNNSNDDTKKILDKFDNKKLKKIFNIDTVSKTENWNRAFSFAEDCDYLVNLHSDDILNTNCLSLISNYIESNPVVISGPNLRINYSNSNRNFYQWHFPFSYSSSNLAFKRILTLSNPVGIVGTAIKSSVFFDLKGWSNQYNFYQDVDLWYRLSEIGEILYTPKLFGCYREAKNIEPSSYIEESILWYRYIIERYAHSSLSSFAKISLNQKLCGLPNEVKSSFTSDLNLKIDSFIKENNSFFMSNYPVKFTANILKLIASVKKC